MAVAFGLAATWPGAAAAIPGSGPHETVDITLTTRAPGASAGLTYTATYHAANDPQATPPPLRRILIVGPPGSGGDTTATAQCNASDAQLKAMGNAACPPASRVGSGVIHLLSSASPQPQTYDSTVFNADQQQVELVNFGPFGLGVARSTIHGNVIDGTVPTCITGGDPPSGCPSDQIRILSQTLTTVPVSSGSGAAQRDLLFTPPYCPAAGLWQTHVSFDYADGSVDTVVTEQPCVPAGGSTAGPAPAGGNPACSSRRRISLSGLAAEGLRSISVRLDGRTRRLNPRHPVVDLRGLPRGRYAVTILATTRSGRRLRLMRRYRTCTPGSG